jgi:ketosteroid isomerase-like protein
MGEQIGFCVMDRDHALSVLQALHDAQNAMYSGGEADAVRALLSEEIEWHVPGENAITDDYHRVEEVVDYFHRRQALASNTLRLHPGEITPRRHPRRQS